MLALGGTRTTSCCVLKIVERIANSVPGEPVRKFGDSASKLFEVTGWRLPSASPGTASIFIGPLSRSQVCCEVDTVWIKCSRWQEINFQHHVSFCDVFYEEREGNAGGSDAKFQARKSNG